jgi:uncharacterized membrane protein
MTTSRLPASVFVALIFLGAARAIYYSQRIPEVVASHFGSQGWANAWSSRGMFFAVETSMIVVVAVLTFAVPRIISAMPISLINLPNKQFWLSAERREQTLSYMRAQFAWFGCALLAFLLFVMELAFRANLGTPPRLDNSAFVPALLLFLAFVAVWGLRFAVHFSRTEAAADDK